MHKPHILYIEDNRDLREMIGLLMEEMNCQVALCGSAEEALQIWDSTTFDLVLTDVSLPGISGVDLARQMLAARPQQWIAICSGYEFGNELKAIGSNVRILPKPFEIEDLETLLNDISASTAR